MADPFEEFERDAGVGDLDPFAEFEAKATSSGEVLPGGVDVSAPAPVTPPNPTDVNPQVAVATENVGDLAYDALQGFGQGASYGFSDELAGAYATALKYGLPAVEQLPQLFDKSLTPDEVAYRLFGTRSAKEVPYLRVRNEQRKEIEKGQERNPIASAVGSVLGAVSAPGPKQMLLGKEAYKVPEAATRLGRAAVRAKEGALGGAIAGAGFSGTSQSNDPLEIAELARSASTGAGIGAIANPILGASGDALAKWLRNRAADNALRSIGGSGPVLKETFAERFLPGQPLSESQKAVRDVGTKMLDDDIVRTFSSTENVVDRLARAERSSYGGVVNPTAAEALQREMAESPALMQKLVSELPPEPTIPLRDEGAKGWLVKQPKPPSVLDTPTVKSRMEGPGKLQLSPEEIQKLKNLAESQRFKELGDSPMLSSLGPLGDLVDLGLQIPRIPLMALGVAERSSNPRVVSTVASMQKGLGRTIPTRGVTPILGSKELMPRAVEGIEGFLNKRFPQKPYPGLMEPEEPRPDMANVMAQWVNTQNGPTQPVLEEEDQRAVQGFKDGGI